MPSFDPKHTDDLKAWLIKELEPICDADPEVLSDYVLALLKHDAEESEQQSMLTEQLEDFLAENTKTFVTKVLTALRNQAYLPVSKQPSAANNEAASRKRSADDEGRRSPSKSHRDLEATTSAAGRSEGGRRDRENGKKDQQRHKPQCRDFHQRGFCARGDSCKFDHSLPEGAFPPNLAAGQGNQAFGVQQFGMLGGNHQFGGVPQVGPHGWSGSAVNGQSSGDGGELAMRIGGPMYPAGATSSQNAPFDANHRGGRGGGRGGRGGGRGGRGGRGTFERRPTSDTTLVIENIPAENLDLVKINEYFKKFGTITNIQIDASSKKALVSYSQAAEAKAAHSSPEVIFNNRFVRVFFQRLDEAELASKPAQAAAPAPPKNNFAFGQNKFVRPDLAQEKAKEFQATAQKKLDDLMAEQKEVMTKLTSGSASAEEKKNLMAKFSTLESEIKKATQELRNAVTGVHVSKENTQSSLPTLDPSALQEQRERREREQLDRELEAHSKGGQETSEELKAKLAKLEAEATDLGINPTDVISAAGRGGYRGRGRASFRGASRGYSSFYRGRGASTMANRASMSLDNRTSKVHVTDVPEAGGDKTKEFFKQFGEVNSFEDKEDGSFVVFYKARTSGEKALRSGLSVPEIGSVKATWSNDGAIAQTSAEMQDTSTDSPAAEGEEEREDHFRRS